MSYYTRVFGQLDITPVLTWAEVKGSPWLPDGDRAKDTGLCIEVDEAAPVDTEDGILVVRSAARVVAANSRINGDGSAFMDWLDELVDVHGEGHSFDGWFEGDGERSEDLWRAWVDENGKAVLSTPGLAWPPGPWTHHGDPAVVRP